MIPLAAVLMILSGIGVGPPDAQATEFHERSLPTKGMEPALRTVIGLLQTAEAGGIPDPNRVLIPVLERIEASSETIQPEDRPRPNRFAVKWMGPREILRRVQEAEAAYLTLAGQVCYDSNGPREYRLAGDPARPPEGRGTEVLVAVVDRGLALFAKHKEADGAGRLHAYWPCREPRPLPSDVLCRGAQMDGTSSVHGSVVAEIINRIHPEGRYLLAEVGPDMADAVIAIDRVYRVAASLGMRAVINLSLNVSLGPHDGSSLLEQILTSYCSQQFVIVASAGNEARSARHMAVASDHAQTGSLVIPFQIDRGEAESDLEVCLDLWFDGKVACTASVVKGDDWRLTAAADTSRLACGAGLRVAVCNDQANPLNGHTNIFVLLKADRTQIRDMEGDWYIRLTCDTSRKFVCHGWMTSARGCEGRFTDYVSREVTISGPATARGVVAVGAFLPEPWGDRFCSQGPARDGRPKPEVLVRSKHATSHATAMITGLLARAMHDHPGSPVPVDVLLKGVARAHDSIQLHEEALR